MKFLTIRNFLIFFLYFSKHFFLITTTLYMEATLPQGGVKMVLHAAPLKIRYNFKIKRLKQTDFAKFNTHNIHENYVL